MRLTAMVVFILIGSRCSRWCSRVSTAASGRAHAGRPARRPAGLPDRRQRLHLLPGASSSTSSRSPSSSCRSWRRWPTSSASTWSGSACMICVNMQTCFMHPPFGFALFYLRGIADTLLQEQCHCRARSSRRDIYLGAIPYRDPADPGRDRDLLPGVGDRLPRQGAVLDLDKASEMIERWAVAATPSRSRSGPAQRPAPGGAPAERRRRGDEDPMEALQESLSRTSRRSSAQARLRRRQRTPQPLFVRRACAGAAALQLHALHVVVEPGFGEAEPQVRVARGTPSSRRRSSSSPGCLPLSSLYSAIDSLKAASSTVLREAEPAWCRRPPAASAPPGCGRRTWPACRCARRPRRIRRSPCTRPTAPS